MENLLNEAQSIFDKADYETALNKYEKIQELNSDSSEALVGMGNCYMRLQNPEKAEACFIRAKTHDQNNFKAWLGLGLLELYRANTKQAEIYLIRVVELNPESDKAFCALGILKANTNDLKAAEEYYCRALDLNIENLLANKSLIELSYVTENYSAAYKYLKSFLDIYPANLNMLFVMAGLQFKMGRVEDSLKTLDDVLFIDPNHKFALEFQKSVRAVSVE